MLTLGDKKWIKAYFDGSFDRKFPSAFDKSFDKSFDKAFKPAFKEAFGEVDILLRNDIAQFKDDILTELHPLREDHDVLSYHSSEHSDQLENHDRRITALERHNPRSPVAAVSEKVRLKYKA